MVACSPPGARAPLEQSVAPRARAAGGFVAPCGRSIEPCAAVGSKRGRSWSMRQACKYERAGGEHEGARPRRQPAPRVSTRSHPSRARASRALALLRARHTRKPNRSPHSSAAPSSTRGPDIEGRTCAKPERHDANTHQHWRQPRRSTNRRPRPAAASARLSQRAGEPGVMRSANRNSLPRIHAIDGPSHEQRLASDATDRRTKIDPRAGTTMARASRSIGSQRRRRSEN